MGPGHSALYGGMEGQGQEARAATEDRSAAKVPDLLAKCLKRD